MQARLGGFFVAFFIVENIRWVTGCLEVKNPRHLIFTVELPVYAIEGTEKILVNQKFLQDSHK
jgi:hypothetical protein